MNENESILNNYYIEVTCMLTEMTKEEAIDFFEKYSFNDDEIFITVTNDKNIELYHEIDDDNIDEYNEMVIDSTLDYSENIVDELEEFDDDIKVFVVFEEKDYNRIYVQMMKDKIYENDGNNKTKIFADLFEGYLKYLEMPDSQKCYKNDKFSSEEIKNYSLNNFVERFLSDDNFSTMILMSYYDLREYELKTEINNITSKYKSPDMISTINDIIRDELYNKFENLYEKYQDRLDVFNIIYNDLINSKYYLTEFFELGKKVPLCNSDYAKLLIINDGYLMSEMLVDQEEYTENTIINVFETSTQSELLYKFNNEKGFALRCFLLFVQFNFESDFNIIKAESKRTFGKVQILKKINKLHFLDYISNS